MSEYYPMLKKELDCCVVMHDFRSFYFGERYILEQDGTFGKNPEMARRFSTRSEAKLWELQNPWSTKPGQTLQIVNEEAAVRYMGNGKVAPVQPAKKEDRPD